MPIAFQFWTIHRLAKTEDDDTLRVPDDTCVTPLFWLSLFHIITDSDSPYLTESPYTHQTPSERILDLGSRASAEYKRRKKPDGFGISI